MEALADTVGAPIRMWADPQTVEDATMAQVRAVAELPWVHAVAVMPDVHLGAGAAIGSVIAMHGAVAPAAVGVDIGCGMSAVATNLQASELPGDLARLRKRIEAVVPVGQAVHKTPVELDRVPGISDWDGFWSGFERLHPGVSFTRNKAHAQLGTLGGGNHFIELCAETAETPGGAARLPGSDPDRVWLLLHSGSRGVGNRIAAHHMGIARELSHNANLPDRDLAVLLAGTPQMRAYLHDLYWAQDYAVRNRATMLHLLRGVLAEAVPGVAFEEPISCHHNYVAEETYDGHELLVTRKGAIRAGAGEPGIVPGSMGTGSYLVRGLGNEDAFNSAAHGAGRRMSRAKARQSYTTRDLATQTRGVECRKDSRVVDELPAAYKDLDEVMAAQDDLVEVRTRLRPLVCVKG